MLVLEEGLSTGQVAQRLSLPKSTLESWVRAAKVGKLGTIGKDRRPLTEVEVELARTKKELAMIRNRQINPIWKVRPIHGSFRRTIRRRSHGTEIAKPSEQASLLATAYCRMAALQPEPTGLLPPARYRLGNLWLLAPQTEYGRIRESTFLSAGHSVKCGIFVNVRHRGSPVAKTSGQDCLCREKQRQLPCGLVARR